MATIAVFVALGGSSYAALVITGKSVKDGSLTGKDIRDRSLKARDLARGVLPKGGGGGTEGKQGPVGPAGPTGPAGPAGPAGGGAGSITVRKGFVAVPGGAIGGATASCSSGETATGGGAKWRTSPDAGPIVSSSPTPTDAAPTGWTVRLDNQADSERQADVFVVCIGAGS